MGDLSKGAMNGVADESDRRGFDNSRKIIAKIQDLKVDYEMTEDPFGQGKSAEMLIQGRLIRAEMELRTSSADPLTSQAEFGMAS